MPSLFLAMAAAALLSLGARDQILLARLAQFRKGSGGALVAAALGVTALSSGLMAGAGAHVSELLPTSAKHMLVAFALAAAALELAWTRKYAVPREPTNSLFALVVVLLWRQLGDAARFAVFALAAATGVPMLSGLGGWIGASGVLVVSVLAADELSDPARLRPLRWVLAGLCAIAAAVIGLGARGLL